jgi:hypothetical protein
MAFIAHGDPRMLPSRAGRRRTAKPPSPSCRFALEQLEHRLAPAVYHVNTFQDTPAANVNTGQDLSGHVSLRSALAAANGNPHSDVILLRSGIYSVQNAALEVHGDVQIIGTGAGQTVIVANHAEPLFEVDGGNLDLSGLTLNGPSVSGSVKDEVHLTHSEITDADIAAVFGALAASKEEVPGPLAAANRPRASRQADLEAIQPLTSPEHLLGPVGRSFSTTVKDQDPETGQEPHQTFWRIDTETPPEPEPVDKPDNMDQNSTAVHGLGIAARVFHPAVTSVSATKELMVVRVEPKQRAAEMPGVVIEQPIATGFATDSDGSRATLAVLAATCGSFRSLATHSSGLRGSFKRDRRRRVHRLYRPAGRHRHTCGPQASYEDR